MNEFQLISYLTEGLKKDRKNLIKGIGDDAAVLHCDDDKEVLWTTDSLVENIHFRLDYKISREKLWYYLGWKALAINVSDIYSMGGEPKAALVSLHIPRRILPRWLKIFYKGLNDCSRKYNVIIVGGNISSSLSDCVISVSMIGLVRKGDLLLRENAKAGDHIYVQKGLGRARAGLERLQNGCKKIDELVLSHLRPTPSFSWKPVRKRYRINAVIDISDGFLNDLDHILKSSNKGALINISDLPGDADLERFFPKERLEFQLHGGEDYGVILTSPDLIKDKNLYPVGRITHKRGLLLDFKDKKVRISNKDLRGYNHFN
ncbi:MAG: thiamine-phosphate kinase [Spirochaetes bacterium]|nr:thiamine-phosphate kinase [Spirochaetota bacterium]